MGPNETSEHEDGRGLSLPVIEEAGDTLYEAVAGGQPVLLVREGQPAVVVVDIESWQEVEVLTSGE